MSEMHTPTKKVATNRVSKQKCFDSILPRAAHRLMQTILCYFIGVFSGCSVTQRIPGSETIIFYIFFKLFLYFENYVLTNGIKILYSQNYFIAETLDFKGCF